MNRIICISSTKFCLHNKHNPFLKQFSSHMVCVHGIWTFVHPHIHSFIVFTVYGHSFTRTFIPSWFLQGADICSPVHLPHQTSFPHTIVTLDKGVIQATSQAIVTPIFSPCVTEAGKIALNLIKQQGLSPADAVLQTVDKDDHDEVVISFWPNHLQSYSVGVT